MYAVALSDHVMYLAVGFASTSLTTSASVGVPVSKAPLPSTSRVSTIQLVASSASTPEGSSANNATTPSKTLPQIPLPPKSLRSISTTAAATGAIKKYLVWLSYSITGKYYYLPACE